jgi:hypothetical protein
VQVVSGPLMAELGTLGHPARVICIFRIDSLPERVGGDLGIHLHRVIDPGNVGTVVRAAGALGPAFVSLSPGCSDPLSGKGVRASMGAVFRVPIEHAELPPEGQPRRAGAGRRTGVWQPTSSRRCSWSAPSPWPAAGWSPPATSRRRSAGQGVESLNAPRRQRSRSTRPCASAPDEPPTISNSQALPRWIRQGHPMRFAASRWARREAAAAARRRRR